MKDDEARTSATGARARETGLPRMPLEHFDRGLALLNEWRRLEFISGEQYRRLALGMLEELFGGAP